MILMLNVTIASDITENHTDNDFRQKINMPTFM